MAVAASTAAVTLRQHLQRLVSTHFPPVAFAMAYGSAVFEQTNTDPSKAVCRIGGCNR